VAKSVAPAQEIVAEADGVHPAVNARAARPGVALRWLTPLLVLFVIKQILLVAIIGPFTGHDEVDHFSYIARLAAGDGLGVVGEVRLPKDLAPYYAGCVAPGAQAVVGSACYVADPPFNSEVIQPPLYHLLMVPIYLAVPGGILAKLYALRLISVLIGLGVVWLAYLTARLLFPNDALIVAGVPIFVAFQPQFSFEAAIVNHDILLIFLFSLLMYLLLRGLRDGVSPRLALAMGLIGAAGLWTKVSFALALPVVVVGLFMAWRDTSRSWRALIGWLALAVVLPMVLALPWFVRSYELYGDPTGTSRLGGIYAGTASTYWGMISSPGFWQGRLEDFWGNYGWRLIPFDTRDNLIIWLVWAVCGVGLLALIVRGIVVRFTGGRHLLDRFQWRGLFLLGLSFVALLYGMLYVGTIQFTQSRFVFPAMIGIGTLTVVGVDRWLPARTRAILVPVLVAALLFLNVYVALRYILPFYYGPGGGAVIYP